MSLVDANAGPPNRRRKRPVGPVAATGPLDTGIDGPSADGARDRAIARGRMIARADLEAAGGAYSLAEVLDRMGGVTPRMVAARERNRSLLAVREGDEPGMYPKFQFNPDGSLLRGLKQVRAALPTDNCWTALNFFVNPQDALGGDTPITRLRSGAVHSVVEAAKRIGEQGA